MSCILFTSRANRIDVCRLLRTELPSCTHRRHSWMVRQSRFSCTTSVGLPSSRIRSRPTTNSWSRCTNAAAQPISSPSFSTMPFPHLMHPETTSSENYNDPRLEDAMESLTSSWLRDTVSARQQGLYSDDAYRSSMLKAASSLDQELGLDYDRDTDDEFEELDDDVPPSSPRKVENHARTESVERKDLQKSAMEILRNFDPQDPPSTDDPEELQLWLECAAQREAVLKLQNLVKKARERKAYDSMSLMQRHIVQWFEDLKTAIEIRQKEYLSNKDTRRAKTRYGPFLCSLPPEKMAVISAHEAMTQCLLLSGKTGREGVPLAKIAAAIGSAVETEVLSQQRMKERFYNPTKNEEIDCEPDDDPEATDTGKVKNKPEKSEQGASSIDRWKFSASHLKLFMAELERIDPKMGKKSKRSIAAAVVRAKQAMNKEEGWTKDDALHLGAALLAILVENTKVNTNGKQEPAFRVEKRWTPRKKSISFVVLNENLYSMFTEDELVSWAASTTRYTPMIVPPKEWTGPRNGGYRWLKASLMRTHGSRVQHEALKQGNLGLVYDGLNILGRTAWKINKEILEIGKTCWTRNIPMGDIPSRTDLEVPPEPKRPERIPPAIYADKNSPAAIAANEANKMYRENMYKRQRIIQKNMVSLTSHKNSDGFTTSDDVLLFPRICDHFDAQQC